jgi:galactose oxidase
MMDCAASAPLPIPRDGANPRILVANGVKYHVGDELMETDMMRRVHEYDPETATWTRNVDLGIKRCHSTSCLLPDGKVLVATGHNKDRVDANTPQTYDPETGTFANGTPWVPAYDEERQRGYHSFSLLLPDASILVGGGRTHTTPGPAHEYFPDEQATCRVYFPKYLDPQFEPRPAITDIREGGKSTMWFAYDQTRFIDFENGPVHRIVLMAPGSMTHSFDQNQRCIVLKDMPDGEPSPVEVIGPRDAQVAPSGYYLLFILRRQGGELIPCVASWVWVA